MTTVPVTPPADQPDDLTLAIRAAFTETKQYVKYLDEYLAMDAELKELRAYKAAIEKLVPKEFKDDWHANKNKPYDRVEREVTTLVVAALNYMNQPEEGAWISKAQFRGILDRIIEHQLANGLKTLKD